MIKLTGIALLLALLSLAGCTTLPPTGPSVMALPGTGMSFEQFRGDDMVCRNFALEQTGITPGTAASDSGAKSAAIGTAVGAVAGAAIGGSSGAGVGAGTGLVVGSVAGAGSADRSWYQAQQRYNMGYLQCMYAKGHKIPVSGRFVSPAGDQALSPPAGYPPPGYPPPPPPPPR